MRPIYPAAVMAAAFLFAVSGTQTRADPIPAGAVGWNVEAVGYSNLNDKPGFKMSIQRVGERWYLYIGMLWNEGWHIVDVTDDHLVSIGVRCCCGQRRKQQPRDCSNGD